MRDFMISMLLDLVLIGLLGIAALIVILIFIYMIVRIYEICCGDKADKAVDVDKETKELLEKMLQETGYVSVSDLAERFAEIDEYYEHEPWNLLQILSNIDIFVPVKISTNKYIFYSKGTNHENADDVAITEAVSLDEAVENFKKYYANASNENVQIVDCHREGFVENMMIVSTY